MKITHKTIFSLILLGAFLLAQSSWAKAKIEDITYQAVSDSLGQVTVSFSGEILRVPELSFGGNFIQMSFPETFIWPKLEKRVSLEGRGTGFDGTLLGYQYSKDLVRVRTLFPYQIDSIKDNVKVSYHKNKIEIVFPRPGSKSASASQYDETYLNSLLQEKEKGKAGEEGIERKTVLEGPDPLTQDLMKGKDEVKSSFFSSPERKGAIADHPPKETAEGLSLNHYLWKFLVVLTVVLLLFFGTVHFFKKGVLSRGKLGFLSGSSIVTVLSNTYVGPKRTLVLVKVQNQVFLLGNSESGINLISEIKDVVGLLKKGELSVAGDNFDTGLSHAFNHPAPEGKIRLKEESGEKVRMTAERVSFSEQIKSRIKELRPLGPN